jgi:hypothetical protein
MASVYLHLVIHGFAKLELLDTIIAEVLELLQDRVSTSLLPSLVCPLFIIGSVAKPEDESIFRSIISSRPLHDPALLHRERILPVLEEIWKGRRTISGFEWKHVLELAHDVLLI